ncbi:FAD-dependent monooxygenase [Streptomyces sp. NRRL B-1347]|uniref:FAD-dependent monooxygenase n=1 Tax=Streptomyces sp. NRRL B-1347 TaxID=1476877 RepID=UPI00068FCCBA|nr:FAD-dependent monooxygenase [Streptomyces sp. NRRL B-1347]
MNSHVLIAGAGIGGLTAALSLHAVGIGVTVVDSVREIRPLGVGINLQPQAVGVLTELGLGDALAAVAIPTAEHRYADSRGEPMFADPRGLARGYRWPQYSIHRGELQMLLLDAVRERLGADAVRTGNRVERFIQTEEEVRVRVTDRATGAASVLSAGLLVGADGLHSTVRAALHPEQGPLLWSGVRMWRGVLETERFVTGRSAVIATDGPRPDGKHDAQFLAYPISRPADDRGRSLLNWVALVIVAEPGPLDPAAADWNAPARPEDVLPHFEGWRIGGRSVHDLVTGSELLLRYPMVDRDPLPRWGEGRVTLLGDAAHPMYPVGANGATQAVIDAGVLAERLAAADDPRTALAAYETERREATTRIVEASRHMHASAHSGERAIDAITSAYRAATGG